MISFSNSGVRMFRKMTHMKTGPSWESPDLVSHVKLRTYSCKPPRLFNYFSFFFINWVAPMYFPFLEVVHIVCRLMQPLFSFQKTSSHNTPCVVWHVSTWPTSISQHNATSGGGSQHSKLQINGTQTTDKHWDFSGVPLAQDLPLETKDRKFTITPTPHVHKMAVSNPVGCVCVCLRA